ncbi:MAG: aminoacyl-tRNA hydrolase [Oscillospiraceae bacterium]|nr:aminoacyl-tRNA hydrolase [Oscillospiraceae bacterium]
MFWMRNKAKKKDGARIKYIIAGLGNPGRKYLFNRHNAGFLALDYISEKCGFQINTNKFKSFCARYTAGEDTEKFDVLFMKPQTYMNDSGAAVSEAAKFYKIPPENILVISDDINLSAGKLRMRKSGSDGGQKGLRSIAEHLSSQDFPRIRIGVGQKPNPDQDAAQWVLSDFSKDDKKIMFEAFSDVFECVDMFMREVPIEMIQNKYN